MDTSPMGRPASAVRYGILLGILGLSFMLGAARATAATIGLGEASALPGQSGVGLPLSLTVSSSEQVTAVALDIRFDPQLTQWESVALEPAIAALGKQVQSTLVAPGHTRITIYGLDRQTLANGTIARCLLRISASAVPGASILSLQQTLGSDPNGNELPLAAVNGRVWIDTAGDTLPPTLTVATPTDGAIFFQGDSVVVSGLVTDNKPGVSVTVNGASATIVSGTGFTRTLTGLPAGTHTITVVAVDAAGNRTTAQRFITVKAVTGPAVSILSPPHGSTVVGPSVSLVFTVKGATVRSGDTNSHLHITVDGAKPKHVYNTSPFPMTLSSGQHLVEVQLVDNVAHAPVPGAQTYQRVRFTVTP